MSKFIYISDSETKKMSGVYMITNSLDSRVYIGASTYLGSRCNVHRSALERGCHRCERLQDFYNKNKDIEFYFTVVKLTEGKENLIKEEQVLLDTYKSYEPNFGFNTCSVAGSTKGMKRKQESIDKMKAAWLKNGFPSLGRKASEETKRRLSESHKGKKQSWVLTDEMREGRRNKSSKPVDLVDSNGNIIKSFLNSLEVAKELGIPRWTVAKLCLKKSCNIKDTYFNYSSYTYDQILEMRKSNPI